MRSQGMTDGENYRDLLSRLSTALAMTEAAYLEARHRRDLWLAGSAFLCRRWHLYPVSQDVVMTLMLWSGHTSYFWLYGDGIMRNPTLKLRRTPFPVLR